MNFWLHLLCFLLLLLIMEQHLVQVKNKVGHIEQSIERHQTQTINFINSQRDLNVSLRKSADGRRKASAMRENRRRPHHRVPGNA